MMNINAVLDPTTGDLLEINQVFKTTDYKLWKYVALIKLARLSQVSKNKTIKCIEIIHFISRYQKSTNKKATYAQIVISYQPQKKDLY